MSVDCMKAFKLRRRLCDNPFACRYLIPKLVENGRQLLIAGVLIPIFLCLTPT